jgi:hypothetical protein
MIKIFIINYQDEKIYFRTYKLSLKKIKSKMNKRYLKISEKIKK